MATITQTVSVDVNVEIEIDDLLDDITDEQLAEHGLRRVAAKSGDMHRDVYSAASRGDIPALLRAVEVMAWELDGVFIVPAVPA